jgi:SAM-dependent methyltransferase
LDSSAAMLERARQKVPDGEFHEADLHHLPMPDDHVDLVVCALAMMHVPDLEPVLAEFVRVLRPGGNLVISDSRGLIKDIGLPVVKAGPDGRPGYMPIWSRLTSDYLAAALPLGLQVLRCEEPRRPFPLVDGRRAIRDQWRIPRSRLRRSPEHLGPASLVYRRHQRRVSRQPRRHHLALPARRSLNSPHVRWIARTLATPT